MKNTFIEMFQEMAIAYKNHIDLVKEEFSCSEDCATDILYLRNTNNSSIEKEKTLIEAYEAYELDSSLNKKPDVNLLFD